MEAGAVRGSAYEYINTPNINIASVFEITITFEIANIDNFKSTFFKIFVKTLCILILSRLWQSQGLLYKHRR